MGYFSNGTEGEVYEGQYCRHCVHQKGPDGESGCGIWLAHMLFNYDECNNDKSILNLLIPPNENGVGNQQCALFHSKHPDRCRATLDMFDEQRPCRAKRPRSAFGEKQSNCSSNIRREAMSAFGLSRR